MLDSRYNWLVSVKHAHSPCRTPLPGPPAGPPCRAPLPGPPTGPLWGCGAVGLWGLMYAAVEHFHLSCLRLRFECVFDNCWHV